MAVPLWGVKISICWRGFREEPDKCWKCGNVMSDPVLGHQSKAEDRDGPSLQMRGVRQIIGFFV